MRHRVSGKKLNRNSAQRKALFMNLTRGVFLHGRIKTSLAKAKAARGTVEKIITIAKKGDLSSFRRIAAFFRGDSKLTKKIIEEIAPVYEKRKGGYTRIIKGGYRVKDNCPLAYLELLDKKRFLEGKEEKGKSKKESKEKKAEKKKDVKKGNKVN